MRAIGRPLTSGHSRWRGFWAPAFGRRGFGWWRGGRGWRASARVQGPAPGRPHKPSAHRGLRHDHQREEFARAGSGICNRRCKTVPTAVPVAWGGHILVRVYNGRSGKDGEHPEGAAQGARPGRFGHGQDITDGRRAGTPPPAGTLGSSPLPPAPSRAPIPCATPLAPGTLREGRLPHKV